jgi:hypothetical protein
MGLALIFMLMVISMLGNGRRINKKEEVFIIIDKTVANLKVSGKQDKCMGKV